MNIAFADPVLRLQRRAVPQFVRGAAQVARTGRHRRHDPAGLCGGAHGAAAAGEPAADHPVHGDHWAGLFPRRSGRCDVGV